MFSLCKESIASYETSIREVLNAQSLLYCKHSPATNRTLNKLLLPMSTQQNVKETARKLNLQGSRIIPDES